MPHAVWLRVLRSLARSFLPQLAAGDRLGGGRTCRFASRLENVAVRVKWYSRLGLEFDQFLRSFRTAPHTSRDVFLLVSAPGVRPVQCMLIGGCNTMS